MLIVGKAAYLGQTRPGTTNWCSSVVPNHTKLSQVRATTLTIVKGWKTWIDGTCYGLCTNELVRVGGAPHQTARKRRFPQFFWR